jgi:hypothetical protein
MTETTRPVLGSVPAAPAAAWYALSPAETADPGEPEVLTT